MVIGWTTLVTWQDSCKFNLPARHPGVLCGMPLKPDNNSVRLIQFFLGKLRPTNLS